MLSCPAVPTPGVGLVAMEVPAVWRKEATMFTLLRMLPLSRVLTEQLPALVGAQLIAEFFYKFHSFSLECAAFLLTWFAIDGVLQLAKHFARGDRATAPTHLKH